MSKRKILLVALSLCLVAVLAGTTLAYLTAKDSATNTFTVGNVAIDLTEPQWDAAGSQDAPEVYPGEALAKDPTVTNTGKNPCFVRVEVLGLDCLGEDNMITYRTNYVVGALGENWVLHTDGYFYYTKVLAVGESTTKLFDSIVIPATLTHLEGEFDVVVNAYAVQAQGAQPSWSAVQAMTVEQIAAWFKTVTEVDPFEAQ